MSALSPLEKCSSSSLHPEAFDQATHFLHLLKDLAGHSKIIFNTSLVCSIVEMKLSIRSHCFVLSVFQFTCLFLCHADSDTEYIGSGSGDVPIDIATNRTASIAIEPTSTVTNLLVPFSTDVDQPPPSVSIYVFPQMSSSLSTSLLLPNTVFGPSQTSSTLAPSPGLASPGPGGTSRSTTASPTTQSFLYQTTSLLPQITALASSPSPSPSPLPLVQYIISLTRVVVIEQQQLGAVRSHIRDSLAGLLNLRTTDIIDINILVQQERTRRQSSSEVTFSAVEFYIRDIHSTVVEELQRKVRGYRWPAVSHA